MFKLSTKSEYGVRLMSWLAAEKKPQSLRRVADKENISFSYLEQLAQKLQKSNLLRSLRGAKGGYELAKSPASITLGDIIRSVEESLAGIKKNAERRDQSGISFAKEKWLILQSKVLAFFDKQTLEDFVDRK